MHTLLSAVAIVALSTGLGLAQSEEVHQDDLQAEEGETERTSSLARSKWLGNRGPYDPRPYGETVISGDLLDRSYFDWSQLDTSLGLQLVVTLLLIALAISRSRIVHAWLAMASWLLFLIGVVGYGLRLHV